MKGVRRRPFPTGSGVLLPALLRLLSMYQDGTPSPCAALAASTPAVPPRLYLLLFAHVGYSCCAPLGEKFAPVLNSSSMPSGHLNTLALLNCLLPVDQPGWGYTLGALMNFPRTS